MNDSGPRQPATVVTSDDHCLVYDPNLVPASRGSYTIVGRLEDSRLIPWGFWGGVLMVVVIAALIVFRGSTGLYSMWDLFWTFLAIVIGAGMFKLGARSSLRPHRLVTIEVDRGMLVWENRHNEDAPSIVLPFEEITEIVFGMTNYPLSPTRKDINIHAFTLLVRDGNERLIPIIEASPNKEETHRVAAALAQLLKQQVTYVGIGSK
jgi:hypothetical protein